MPPTSRRTTPTERMPGPSPTIPNLPPNLPRLAKFLSKLRINSGPPIRRGPAYTSDTRRKQRRKSPLHRRQKQLPFPFRMRLTHGRFSQIGQKNQSHLRGRGPALI